MLHIGERMSSTMAKNPKSYEEIVRQTVVDPDSSARPTLQQEQAGREGFRALDADERVLHDRVLGALATSGMDVSGVTVEITRELVTLRGRVTDSAVLRTLEDTVARVSGVDTIHNLVVVGSP
jgi:osmotically-inducible protein OsmY